MFKKILIGFGIVVAIVAGVVVYVVKEASAPPDMAKAHAMEQKSAPTLTIATYPDGQKMELSQLYGKKPIYLNFWATWCPPCVREMPYMNELYPQYKDKLDFVVVSVDSKRASLDAFIEKTGYDLPIYTTDNESANKAFELQGIPTSVLITPEGKIAKIHIGSMSKEEMEAFFQEGTALK